MSATIWPGYKVANICWWSATGAAIDFAVTPWPTHHPDGRTSPGWYTIPPPLHEELIRDLGQFPLFSSRGPGAGVASSEWITASARRLIVRERPDLTLVHLPHLAHDLQRHGPDTPQAEVTARMLDTVMAPLLADARTAGAVTIVLSGYGITGVSRPVDINRALRRAGLLHVYQQAGLEYLDPWTSPAFAVADHQLAHVYVRGPADLAAARSVLGDLTGVDQVLDADGKAGYGLDHERAGELVVVAAPDAWFTYYYWLDESRAPDFTRTVHLHREPGHDPADLFRDPVDPMVRVRPGVALVRKRLGLRRPAPATPLDPSLVQGSHGRLPRTLVDGPVLLCSEPLDRGEYAATDVKALLLALAASTS